MSSSSDENVHNEQPKGIAYRFWIGCMVFMTTFTCYTTRVNFSVSIVSMTKGKTKGTPYCKRQQQLQEDSESTEAAAALPNFGPRYDWDERVQGALLGGYFYGYVIFNLLSGIVIELLRPFKVILFAHLIAVVANTACAFAPLIHWGCVFACRFILGICGAMIYPALQKLIANWAPPEEKGKFSGALMGNVLGTCCTWVGVGVVTTHFGWDWGFYIVSIQNFLFCILFAIIVTDSPLTHRWVSEDERNHITESQKGTVTQKKLVAPYKDILSNVACWMLTICHFTNDYGLYLQLTLAPKFISDVIGFKLDQTGGLSSLPPLMRMTCGLILGTIADVLLVKGIFRKVVVRKSFTVLSHLVSGSCLIGIAFVGCKFIPAIILLTLSLGLNGACVQNILINTQDLAPNFAGSLYAINSFFAGMPGIIAPALNAEFTKDQNGVKEWSYTFLIGGCVMITGGVIWILFGSVEEQPFNRKGDPG